MFYVVCMCMQECVYLLYYDHGYHAEITNLSLRCTSATLIPWRRWPWVHPLSPCRQCSSSKISWGPCQACLQPARDSQLTMQRRASVKFNVGFGGIYQCSGGCQRILLVCEPTKLLEFDPASEKWSSVTVKLHWELKYRIYWNTWHAANCTQIVREHVSRRLRETRTSPTPSPVSRSLRLGQRLPELYLPLWPSA